MKYSFDSCVRFSEVGEDQKLTLGSVINYFQDCSTFQSESLGAGVEFLRKQHRVWVLSSWQVVIERYPALCEKIRITTWAYGFKRFLGNRNFTMEDEAGNVVAYANSIWTYLNTETGLPVAVSKEQVDAYGLEEKFSMEYAPRKIAVPEGGMEYELFPVRSHNLDTNHHVNNEQYVAMACEYLPKDFKVWQMRAEYKGQAVLGDIIEPIVYTDEDKLSMDGEFYFEPHFKSDYNLFRLRDNNYICHIFAVKKALVDQVGGLRQEYDGSQDYDFILRCCEQAKQVIHIPRVLYHWRCHMNSVAANPESKTYAYEAGCRAIQEHYRRVGIEAEVEMTKHPGWYRSHVKIQGEPLVSILIPNKDHIDDLEKCLSSIYEKSTWKNYEILVVENNSEKPETFEYYKNLSWRYPKARVLTWKEGFNYAAINNFAAKDAKGSYLLFLNNDVEVITPGWIEEMLMICQQPDVAIVGAKLYYPDNLIQHAGVVLGMGGIAGHIMCQASCEDKGYFGRAVNVQEISAVTAACMLMKVEDFEAVGGFDEEFVVAFNDIDLCMKERAAGKKVVFTPYAELYHYESKSRGMEDTPEKQFRFEKETKHFEEKWGEQMSKGDPYYNPNLSLKEADCSLRED